LWLSLGVTSKGPPTGGITEEFKMNIRLKSPLKQKGISQIKRSTKFNSLKPNLLDDFMGKLKKVSNGEYL
jgi:hypothetical protein